MTQHTCARCFGDGTVCGKCGRNHERAYPKSCRSKKRMPCPGLPDAPHFDTRTECDVCRVARRGPFYRGGLFADKFNTEGWDVTGNALQSEPRLHLCPECAARLKMLRELALEKLKEERGELRAGQSLGPSGETP